jgi:hypothetical protein
VTGIVQEFQFGMDWSDYSRFVGDVFGAPLAVEGLLAFFLESTFLGLWIFGWDRLPGRAHASCMWAVHIGTLFSSYFILAANSWMQHPVGFRYNPETGRAEMSDFWAVMTNKVQLVTLPHTVLAAYMTGAAFVVGRRAVVAGAHRRRRGAGAASASAAQERRGQGSADPVGIIPTAEELNLEGVDITPEDLETILSIDVERWRQEIGFRQTHLEQFPNLPEEIWEAHRRVAKDLNEAESH